MSAPSISTTWCDGATYNVLIDSSASCSNSAVVAYYSTNAFGGQTCWGLTNGEFWCSVPSSGCPTTAEIAGYVAPCDLSPSLSTAWCDGNTYNVLIGTLGSCPTTSSVFSYYSTIAFGGQTCWGLTNGQFWCSVPSSGCPSTAVVASFVIPCSVYQTLATKYAPQIYYHPSETFFASSVEYMFPHYDEVQDSSANALSGYSFPLNATNVDIVYKSGGDASGQYLSISAKPVATPSITSGYEFLYSSASIGTKAPIYSFVSPKSNGIIDIYYWVFCPYNLGKDVLIAGWTGDHVGDWEYMMVRTVDYEVVSVDYHAHSSTGGTYLATDPTIVWNGTHPIVYTAEGSHGMWPVAGSNVYKTILDIYDLTDDTGAGVAWYTWNNVYAIDYLENRGYTGNQQWLNFDGYFGNPKDTSCLLYSIIGECEFSEGPATPNRGFMAGPPMDVLCTVNSADADHSVYTFQLSAAAQAWAIANGTVNYVAVHQHCTASPSSEATDNWGFIAFDASTGVQSYTVTTDRCKKDYSRYASNYEVGFCSSDAEADCFTVSGLRSLIEYVGDSRPSNPDKNVVVNDLDVWSWSY